LTEIAGSVLAKATKLIYIHIWSINMILLSVS